MLGPVYQGAADKAAVAVATLPVRFHLHPQTNKMANTFCGRLTKIDGGMGGGVILRTSKQTSRNCSTKRKLGSVITKTQSCGVN